MAIRTIVTIPNPILKTKTQEITQIDGAIVDLVKDLLDTLNHAKEPEGAGIAATQLGFNKRVCVVRNIIYTSHAAKGYTSEDFILINPKIISKSKEVDIDWEGCLSVPNQFGKVPRHLKIKVEARTLDGNFIQINAKDLFARVIQHEIDHLDGILFIDKVTKFTNPPRL